MAPSLDYNSLDEVSPFEIDAGNRPHLYVHGYSEDDLWEIWTDTPGFYEPDSTGSAEWIMLGLVPGEGVLMVPLALAKRPDQARPIGLYEPTAAQRKRYMEDL